METMIKYEKLPKYEQVALVGISKSVMDDEINGSVERNQFVGRRLLTLTKGFDPAADDAAQIAKGDGTRLIQTVESVEEFGIRIALGDGFKSRELNLKKVLVCTDTKDNKDAKIVFVKWDNKDNDPVFNKIRSTAPKMLAAHPDAFDDWNLIDKNGNRVFIYTYSDVNEQGKGVPQD